MLVCPMVVPAAATVVAVTREFTAQATDTGAGPNYSFASQSLGTETSSRFIVVAAIATLTGSISSVTVGGVACTQAQVTSGPSGTNAEIWYSPKVSAAGPTGTSATVAVTVSAAALNCSICVYAVKNAGSVTPSDAQNDITAPLSVTLNVPANGVAIACARTNPDITWTGLTEDSDLTIESGGHTAASAEFTVAQPTLTVSNSGAGGGAMSTASWGP